MVNLSLTDEQFEILVDELMSLHGYHWNDDSIHADDCGSKILPFILATADVEEQKIN